MSNPNNEALALNDLLVIAEDVDDPWGRVNENFQRIMQWTDLLVARNPRIEYVTPGTAQTVPNDQPSTTSGTWYTIDLNNGVSSGDEVPDHAIGALVTYNATFATAMTTNLIWRMDATNTAARFFTNGATGFNNNIRGLNFVFFSPTTKSFQVSFNSTGAAAASSAGLQIYAWLF